MIYGGGWRYAGPKDASAYTRRTSTPWASPPTQPRLPTAHLRPVMHAFTYSAFGFAGGKSAAEIEPKTQASVQVQVLTPQWKKLCACIRSILKGESGALTSFAVRRYPQKLWTNIHRPTLHLTPTSEASYPCSGLASRRWGSSLRRTLHWGCLGRCGPVEGNGTQNRGDHGGARHAQRPSLLI